MTQLPRHAPPYTVGVPRRHYLRRRTVGGELDDAGTDGRRICRRVGAVVTCSTDWWAFSGSRCTVVWRATRIPTTLNGCPTIRRWRGCPERPAASTNTMSRFETEVLTQDGNVEGLGRVNAEWVDRAMTHTAHRRVVLDMDSSESPVHGEQEGARTTVTLGACAITLCSCSTSSVTARAPSCVRETCIARRQVLEPTFRR